MSSSHMIIPAGCKVKLCLPRHFVGVEKVVIKLNGVVQDQFNVQDTIPVVPLVTPCAYIDATTVPDRLIIVDPATPEFGKQTTVSPDLVLPPPQGLDSASYPPLSVLDSALQGNLKVELYNDTDSLACAFIGDCEDDFGQLICKTSLHKNGFRTPYLQLHKTMKYRHTNHPTLLNIGYDKCTTPNNRIIIVSADYDMYTSEEVTQQEDVT
eukprot:NODE_194_length_1230_cov_471.274705_g190_i0.p1 GENE.NODE_194_length_1230_cov_471.274705_g190_i0~~NODE_194_length_1230_cov_471.274705_g190_i0.p1  ORF type:complete len:210 (+),score=61.23 NODE_194_length_1230_cov_471.274705_g190_i0:326-955(+)